MKLIITSGGGITSCLSVRLHDFCNHPSSLKITTIDSTQQFSFYTDWYKNTTGDQYYKNIASFVFSPYGSNKIEEKDLVNFNHGWQYGWYDDIPLEKTSILAAKVCKLHPSIIKRSLEISDLFSIKDRATIIYRGNDKSKEIPNVPYKEILKVAQETGFKKFYIQTDDQNFLEYMIQNLEDVVYNDNIPRIASNVNNYVVSKDLVSFITEFLASLYACSKYAPAVVTTTGNIGLWASLFRGKLEGIYQYHNLHKTYRKLA
jgi:hypothetical protein